MSDIETALEALEQAVGELSKRRLKDPIEQAEIAKQIAPLFVAAREVRGWSAQKLAKIADMNVRPIYKLEQGQKLPSVRWFKQMVWALRQEIP